jgi:O-acetyl-ADP-ribose deacetylase (regulator of RNase III)
MPLIKRATDDMLEQAPWTDIMVNPVNCIGVMGAGLAEAYKLRYPDMYNSYRNYCIAGNLQPGKLHLFHDANDNTTIVNAPTKRHYADSSNYDDVELTIQTLRRYLEKYPLRTVACPMLGGGLGRMDHGVIYQLFEKYLDPLPNIIYICMRPANMAEIPKYLVVAGSREYDDMFKIDIGVSIDAMAEFGGKFSDFEAMVSGGARGVDTVACGPGTPGWNMETLAQRYKMKGIVALSDWERYGKTAGFIRNKTLLEIGTHFVLFIGKRSVGTRMMKDLIDRHNKRVDQLIVDNNVDPSKIPEYEASLPPTVQRKKLCVHHLLDCL